jgi:predicted DNA-binding ribbon-helix-helix protein
MKSLVAKRSIIIAGHKTSVSLEEPFWRGLKDIAQDQHMSLSAMVEKIDANRKRGNLSSALRLFILDRVRTLSSEFSAAHVEAAKLNGGSQQNTRD